MARNKVEAGALHEKRIERFCSLSFWGLEAAPDDEIIAQVSILDFCCAWQGQRHCLDSLFSLPDVQTSDKERRHGQNKLVNQPVRQEAGYNGRPSLYHQAVDACSPRQSAGRADRVCDGKAAGISRSPRQTARRAGFLRGVFGCGNPGRAGGFAAGKHPEAYAGGCQDDGLRVVPIHQAHSQARVIGQHGADAYQDRMVSGAQAMSQAHRLYAAKRRRLAALHGQAAIQALGVTQADQRPPMLAAESGRFCQHGLPVFVLCFQNKA
jgi:hypothetical protein